MLFNSFVFIFAFLPISAALTYALGRWRQSAAKIVLIILSLVFYAWSAARYLPLLLLSLAFTYIVGNLAQRCAGGGKTRQMSLWVTIGVIVDAATLCLYKYTNFTIDNINSVFGTHVNLVHIGMPLAISFFTFQEIAYLVDIARGETKKIGVIDFAVFTTFFPRLISGPIVRYKEFVPQIETRRFGRLIPRNLMVGLVIFAIGLFKKTVIADSIGPHANALFAAASNGHHLNLVAAWLAVLAYSVQLYFDFSGYSDMAIGLARLFGLKLPLNFHSPHRAQSIMEYWRRWHMTLQRFIVSYIFHPLALPLNRAAARMRLDGSAAYLLTTALPVFITFVVLGIWHGAGWPYVVFGAMHGVYVAANGAWREFCRYRKKTLKRAGKISSPPGWLERATYHVLTLTAVIFANVMFRAPNVADGVSIWTSMTGLSAPDVAGVPGFDWSLIATLVIGAVVVFFLPNTQQIMAPYDPAANWQEWRNVGRPMISWTWKPSASGLLFAGAALFLGIMFIQSGHAVFLYFNF